MSRAALVLGALSFASATLALDLSCKTYGTGGGDGGVNPAGPPIVIGASIAMTGVLNGQVRALRGGIATAQQQLNALGGILDRRIEFDYGDDASQPDIAKKVVTTLLSSGSVGVLGPAASSEVQSVYPLMRMAQKVEISATATSILLTQGYAANQGWFFRTVPSDTSQGEAVAEFAVRGPNGQDASTGHCKRMAIVYNADAYGMPMDQIIEPQFKKLGGDIVYSKSVPANATGDYSEEANAIVNAYGTANQPDCMAMVVFSLVGDQLVQAVTSAMSTDTMMHPSHDWSSFFIIGTDGCYDPTFISNGRVNPSDPMSASFVQGVYGTTADTNPPNRVEYNDFTSLYEAEVGYEPGMTQPDPYTSSQYDAVILLALAIQAAGSTDGPAIQKAMFDVSRGKAKGAMTYGPAQVPDAIQALKRGLDINYNGAAGDEDFDNLGNVVGDFIIWQVKGSSFVTHDYIAASQL